VKNTLQLEKVVFHININVTCTHMNNRSIALDGWRGVAILCVLIGHFLPVKGINLGRAGVELFFALSGCLIGLVLFHQRMPLKEFGLRRFARIVPSMWIFLIIAVPIAYYRGEHGMFSVIYAFLGILNYSDPPIWRISHLWSIGVELQGYFLLAMIAFICRKSAIRPHVLILFFIFISWTIIAFTVPGKIINYYEYFWRTEYRMTAMLAAAALISVTPQLASKNHTWVIYMTVGLLLQTNPIPDAIKYTIGSALLALLLRYDEVLSRIFHTPILEVAHHALRVLFQHRHMLIRGST
jgi:peptidoglycan/LPS O-acetylase OafA/YrhL